MGRTSLRLVAAAVFAVLALSSTFLPFAVASDAAALARRVLRADRELRGRHKRHLHNRASDDQVLAASGALSSVWHTSMSATPPNTFADLAACQAACGKTIEGEGWHEVQCEQQQQQQAQAAAPEEEEAASSPSGGSGGRVQKRDDDAPKFQCVRTGRRLGPAAQHQAQPHSARDDHGEPCYSLLNCSGHGICHGPLSGGLGLGDGSSTSSSASSSTRQQQQQQLSIRFCECDPGWHGLVCNLTLGEAAGSITSNASSASSASSSGSIAGMIQDLEALSLADEASSGSSSSSSNKSLLLNQSVADALAATASALPVTTMAASLEASTTAAPLTAEPAGVDGTFVCSMDDDCGVQGVCRRGQCLCTGGFLPPRCQVRTCPDDCFGHGICRGADGTCDCDPGWGGPSCAEAQCAAVAHACTECKQRCHSEHGLCDGNCRCLCATGFTGADCSQRES